LKLPTGVRAADTMTMSWSDMEALPLRCSAQGPAQGKARLKSRS
jgi:hypothetical protein